MTEAAGEAQTESERMSGIVTQVLPHDELGGYAVPSEIVEGIGVDEDLVVMLTDPFSDRVRTVLEAPVLNLLIEVVWAFCTLLPGVEPLHQMQGGECLVVESGTISEGEWLTADVTEAVVEQTTTRAGVSDRTVWLYAVREIRERSDSRPAAVDSDGATTPDAECERWSA